MKIPWKIELESQAGAAGSARFAEPLRIAGPADGILRQG